MRVGKQFGAISGVGLVLLLLLLVGFSTTVWVYKKKQTARELTRQTEIAQSAPPPDAPISAAGGSAPARPIVFGLSFALVPPADGTPADVVHVGCHGEPHDLERPHKDSCNPYQGDTSCRVTLPVLCLKPGGATLPAGVASGFYAGWTGGTLAATQPVMGALLESVATASARCAAELGAGWRMAEFHDGGGGWGLQVQRGGGFGAWTRYWVHINDQPGNCWDSKP